MTILENEDLNELTKEGLHLVDFYADWCGPCKMMGEVLNEVTSINIIKVNTDKHSEIALKHGIMSIPTLLFIKNGEILRKEIGFIEKEHLEEIIEECKNQ